MQVRFLFWALTLLTFFQINPPTALTQDFPEELRDKNIKSIQIIVNNSETVLPVYHLNSQDNLIISFDDISAFQDNLYYSLELRDENWKSLDESYDYWLEGNLFNFIENFEFSDYSQTAYVHYQAQFINSKCYPSKAGNYLLKVYRGTDTSNLLFSRKFYVLENVVSINAGFSEPLNGKLLTTHQKLNLEVLASNIPNIIPENLRVNVYQNAIPINKIENIPVQYYINGLFKYDADRYLTFPGNREFNYVDLRNFKFKPFNVESITSYKNKPCINLTPDRVQINYLTNTSDLNGFYYIQSTENINVRSEGDYAWVKFSFAPKNIDLFKQKNIVLDGTLALNGSCESPIMDYDSISKSFVKYAFLKLGFYSYNFYIQDPTTQKIDFPINFSETENDYYIFVYYKYFTDRHQSLVGYLKVNTLTSNRPL